MARYFKKSKSDYDYENGESKWNMEDARHRSVDSFLKLCEAHLINWNLDFAYWALREVKIMVVPKFTESEIKEVNEALNNLEKKRKEWLNRKISDGSFRIALEEFYELLNFLMVEHEMYFIEGKKFVGL